MSISDIVVRRSAGECERLILGEPSLCRGIWVGPWTILDASHGNMFVGPGTTICALTCIYTHSNEARDQLGGDTFTGDVYIGENVFIGTGTTIEPDVKVMSGARIGANSFVRRGTTVETGEFWAGTPAIKKGMVR